MVYFSELVKFDVKVWVVIVGVFFYDYMFVLKYFDDDVYWIYVFLKSFEGGVLDDE